MWLESLTLSRLVLVDSQLVWHDADEFVCHTPFQNRKTHQRNTWTQTHMAMSSSHYFFLNLGLQNFLMQHFLQAEAVVMCQCYATLSYA